MNALAATANYFFPCIERFCPSSLVYSQQQKKMVCFFSNSYLYYSCIPAGMCSRVSVDFSCIANLISKQKTLVRPSTVLYIAPLGWVTESRTKEAGNNAGALKFGVNNCALHKVGIELLTKCFSKRYHILSKNIIMSK